ncbi:MAG: MBL fold metallo-hydrolase [Desulfuromonadales bacterium]|nr:MBL fold metallo-hydrolase [Desulfuromonadales bacterium]
MRSVALTFTALIWGLFACTAEATDKRGFPPRQAPTAQVVSVQTSYTIEPLAANVYAAIARPGSRATTNALFVIGRDYVIAAGAHMSREAINDLYAAIAARTSKPVRYFVLAHHHGGYTNIDFDFPRGQDVLMTWQTWRSLDAEVRDPEYPLMFFNDGLTLRPGGSTVILTNVGKGHTDGDLIVYIPEADVVFASDLLYVDSVGYMASGHMTDWLLALDFIEQLGAEQVVPGYGPVSSVEEVFEFGQYFRDFLTAVLQHIERGDSLEKTIAEFNLPQHRDKDGYEQLIKLNLQRAYHDLKKSFGR